MRLLDSINYFLSLFLETLSQVKRGRIWSLLLAYFALQWLVLFAHDRFYSPAFFGVIHLWVNAIDSQNAVGFMHYPGHFAVLPYFFGWAKFVVSALLEGSVLGAVSILFYRGLPGDNARPKVNSAQMPFLWLQLTLAWLAINGLILLANLYLPALLSPLLTNSPRRIIVFQYLFMPGLYIVIVALFYFSISYCALYGASVWTALKRSLQIFWNRPIMCLCLAAVILAAPVLMSIIGQQQNIIINKFYPELMYWVLVVGLAVDAVVYFFWMGTAVRFLSDQE
ncbi:MAG: hypothetical protein AB1483_13275 [Candidatus Zixiibacteriota bacterium]